jgi:hypothetical protein
VPFPYSIFGFMRISVVKGAQAAVNAATSPSLEGVSGKFLNSAGVPITSSRLSYSEQDARRLWQMSSELTGIQG